MRRSAKSRPATPFDWESSAGSADTPESRARSIAPVAGFDDTGRPDTVDPPVTGVRSARHPRQRAAVRFRSRPGALALAESPWTVIRLTGCPERARAGQAAAPLFGFGAGEGSSAQARIGSGEVPPAQARIRLSEGFGSGGISSAPLLMASSPTRKITWRSSR